MSEDNSSSAKTPRPQVQDGETKAVTTCDRCGGEGQLYTSRYGGNDPDVWPTGECPVCDGTGYELVETEEVDEEEIMRP